MAGEIDDLLESGLRHGQPKLPILVRLSNAIAIGWSVQFGLKIGSSQPRVALAENGDASVSLELLIRSLLATGVTVQEIGQIIATV